MAKRIIRVLPVSANGSPVLRVEFSEGCPMFIIPGKTLFSAASTPDGSNGVSFCQEVDDLMEIVSAEEESVAVENISGKVRTMMFELVPEFPDTFSRRIDEFAEKVYDWIKARYCR